MLERARPRMVSACSALLCIISSQRARMPRTEEAMRTLWPEPLGERRFQQAASPRTPASTMISGGDSRSR